MKKEVSKQSTLRKARSDKESGFDLSMSAVAGKVQESVKKINDKSRKKFTSLPTLAKTGRDIFKKVKVVNKLASKNNTTTIFEPGKLTRAVPWLEQQREGVKNGNAATAALLQQGFKEVFLEFSTMEMLNEDGRMVSRRTVGKPVFVAMCQRLWGSKHDPELFLKLFDYMDCDENNKVDEIEFSIVSCFLLNQRISRSNVDLAYHLFDSNKDGGISQNEFSEMLAALVGTDPDIIRKIPVIQESFEIYQKDYFVGEHLKFYYSISDLRNDPLQSKFISLDKAKEIVSTFIRAGSSQEINTSKKDKDDLIAAVEQCEAEKADKIATSVFLAVHAEVLRMLKLNVLRDFKIYLRTEPYTSITTEVWARFDQASYKTLSFEQFSSWASSVPHLFDFFEKMQDEFHVLIESLYESAQ